MLLDGPYEPFRPPPKPEEKEEKKIDADWPPHLRHRPPVPSTAAKIAEWRRDVKAMEAKMKKRKKKKPTQSNKQPKPKHNVVTPEDRTHDDDEVPF